MKRFISRIKSGLNSAPMRDEDNEDEYVELSSDISVKDEKVVVRSFELKAFDDIKTILETLRKGRTVCLVNIKHLKDKDLPELKRAINKLKKTTDAIDGEIAGFGEDWIVAVPSFATIYKTKKDLMHDAESLDEDM